jgi:predicted acylesterase/phospholipase RssA
MASYLRRVRSGKEGFSLTNLGWQLTALLGPVFGTDAHERRFAEFLSQPGRTNRFERVGPELYIGATDQDAREHVLFGDEGFDFPNISKAVQASSAIHPFFRSVEISGRHYTDGFVTRTSNLVAAIKKGANLIFVIDPFLPLVSPPGSQAKHGLFWNVLQDYKTVAYTRFERVTGAVLRANPQVAAFTFVPSRRMRRLMSTNPMARSYFDAIVIEAYRSTFRRLRDLEHKMGPRLAEYGIELDLPRVVRTVTRLDLARRPTALDLLEPPAPVVSLRSKQRAGESAAPATGESPSLSAG